MQGVDVFDMKPLDASRKGNACHSFVRSFANKRGLGLNVELVEWERQCV